MQFYIVQLAFQAQCLPENLIISGMNSELDDFEDGKADFSKTELLIALLESMITKFRRLFILLDDVSVKLLNEEPIPDFLRRLLEQDLGNVSVAIFRHPFALLHQKFDIADVSIRLIDVQYRSEDITNYVDWKLNKLIKPLLDFSSINIRVRLGHDVIPTSEVLEMMRAAIVSASDNLYGYPI